MNIIPVFVWVSTFVFTAISFVPFAVPTFVVNGLMRVICAILMILGWVIIIKYYLH